MAHRQCLPPGWRAVARHRGGVAADPCSPVPPRSRICRRDLHAASPRRREVCRYRGVGHPARGHRSATLRSGAHRGRHARRDSRLVSRCRFELAARSIAWRADPRCGPSCCAVTLRQRSSIPGRPPSGRTVAACARSCCINRCYSDRDALRVERQHPAVRSRRPGPPPTSARARRRQRRFQSPRGSTR